MSSKVKSIEKALQERKAQRGEEPQVSTFAVEGEKPPRLPRPGECVEILWGDPNTIGGPTYTLGLFVSMPTPGSEEGRVNGWVLMDPGMTMPHPTLVGKTVQVPPLVPVGNVGYSEEPKPLTWRFPSDSAQTKPVVSLLDAAP